MSLSRSPDLRSDLRHKCEPSNNKKLEDPYSTLFRLTNGVISFIFEKEKIVSVFFAFTEVVKVRWVTRRTCKQT